MQYQHTLEFQKILQQALRLRRARGLGSPGGKPSTWEELSLELFAGHADKRMTLMRFDKADLDKDSKDRGRLYLNTGTARDLWKQLGAEIKEALHKHRELYISMFDNRTVANVFSWYYRCHESQIRQLASEDGEGLEKIYFCYKPSFRNRGFVVKSEFRIDPIENEYLDIDERQASTNILDGEFAKEESRGYGISKSGKIWIFLKENVKEQPRIICLFDKHPTVKQENFNEPRRISRMFGTILESDELFGHGVHSYRVCFVSEAADEQSYRDYKKGHPKAPPYDRDKQVNNIPHTATFDRSGTFLDPQAIAWIAKSFKDSSLDQDTDLTSS